MPTPSRPGGSGSSSPRTPSWRRASRRCLTLSPASPKVREMRFKIVDDRRALREKALTFDEYLCDRALEMLKVGIRGHATSSRKSILGTPCPVKRTSNQNRGSRRVLRKRKALSRLRACSLLCEPLSDRIGRQWRFSNARSTRALARYGRSACGRGVYPSHLAASFSTVPSSWSFLMASLMALVSSGLSLFTATAYSSPVATSRTT